MGTDPPPYDAAEPPETGRCVLGPVTRVKKKKKKGIDPPPYDATDPPDTGRCPAAAA